VAERVVRDELCRDGEGALREAHEGRGGPGFLLATEVDAGCVQFGVPRRSECFQDGDSFIHGGYEGALVDA